MTYEKDIIANEEKAQQEREVKGIDSRFDARMLATLGYKEHEIPDGRSLDQELEGLGNSRNSIGDFVISKDGKLMINDVVTGDTGARVGNGDFAMLDELDLDNPEHKPLLKETGARFFRFPEIPRGDERRRQIEDEIATGTVERVLLTKNPDVVGFVYKKQG